MFRYEILWHLDQKYSPEKCDTRSPLFSLIFSDTTFWKTEGSTYEFFRSCETKNFRDNDSPLPCIKLFDTRNFPKHRRVLLWTFSVLLDNNFPEQSRNITLLGIKFFDTRHILKHRRAPLRKILAVWDKKIDKMVVLLISWKIRQHNISEIQGSP